MDFKNNKREYRIVYLDTNALSYFVKFDKFAISILNKYTLNNYAFATSIFNIVELYKTQTDFHLKIKDRINGIPFLILNDYKNIINVESKQELDLLNLIVFAVGVNPLFNIDFFDLMKILDCSITQLKEREDIVNKEIENWNNKKKNIDPKWQQNYHNNMILTMNELLSGMGYKFTNDQFGKYKSLECMAFIKNKFCNEKPALEIKTNSIYDMYNVAVFPYVDEYITERTVGRWLEEFQTKCKFQCAKIVMISDIYKPN